MKYQLEDPPEYVECTPEEWAAAKVSVARKQIKPFFAQSGGYRRSALRAALNSGAFIKPELAVEFRSTIDEIGYRPRRVNVAAFEAEEAQKLQVATDYQALLKQRRTRQGFTSTQHARAVLGPIGFAQWFDTPEGQMTQKLENATSEARFHGQ